MRHLRTPLTVLLAAALLVPASASAGPSEDYLDVYKGYQAAGRVDGCKFTAKKLASAEKGLPPDVDTYAPDFPDALGVALRQRAAGDCDDAAAGSPSGGSAGPAADGASAPGAEAVVPVADGGPDADGGTPAAATAAAAAAGATGATGAAGVTPAPAPEAAPAAGAADGSVASAATREADTSGDVPLPLVLLGILALLALLLALLWALVRFLALDPPWVQAGRHATGEAGWRVSASWAEFADWLRIGR